MRKPLVALLSVALLLGALGAEAGAKKKKKPPPQKVERTEEKPYQAPSLGVLVAGAGGGVSCQQEGVGCVTFMPSATEAYIKIAVDDTAGQKVTGFIHQGDTNGDGINDGFGTFCGEHVQPVAIQPGVEVNVSFYAGACEDGSPSIATSGTITATLSNLP